jgi:hypothetical protein
MRQQEITISYSYSYILVHKIAQKSHHQKIKKSQKSQSIVLDAQSSSHTLISYYLASAAAAAVITYLIHENFMCGHSIRVRERLLRHKKTKEVEIIAQKIWNCHRNILGNKRHRLLCGD